MLCRCLKFIPPWFGRQRLVYEYVRRGWHWRRCLIPCILPLTRREITWWRKDTKFLFNNAEASLYYNFHQTQHVLTVSVLSSNSLQVPFYSLLFLDPKQTVSPEAVHAHTRQVLELVIIVFRFTGRWRWRLGMVVRTRKWWGWSSAMRLWCASLSCTRPTNEQPHKPPPRCR